MRTFTFLLLGMFASFAYSELEQYEIKPGDTLVQILKDKDYGSTYLELLPFVDQVLQLNPAAFSGDNVDSIIPGSLLDLPENPNKPKPEPKLVPVPVPVPVVEAVPEPVPEPEPQTVIGEINTQKGTVDIQRNGELIAVAQQASVFAEDILITNEASVAEVKLIDDTRFKLGPNSALKINKFLYLTSETNTVQPRGWMVAHILRGTVRTITGLLGKLNTNDYTVSSVLTAFIGIRGTDFTVRVCVIEADCGDLFGVSAAVQDGGISFKNRVAEIELDKNEFAQIQSVTQGPVASPIPDGFFDLELNVSQIKAKTSILHNFLNWYNSIF
jgi:hypothetical protein